MAAATRSRASSTRARARRRAGPLIRAAFRGRDASFQTDGVRVPTGFTHVPAEPLEPRASFLIRLQVREPAIGDPSRALHRRLGVGADPDRDRTLDGERLQSSAIDAVIPAGVFHALAGPEQS